MRAQTNQKKCNTFRNLDFRGCENVELSAFYEKKIHTACILEKRKAYRSTPGAPDVRSKHYLRHLTFPGVRKCRTVSILATSMSKSVELSAFSEKKMHEACILEIPMHDLHTIYSIFADPASSPKKTKKHTACILDTRRAYRSTPGAPDARFAYYLQHFCGSGN